jgi:hypothetical protein
MMTTTKKSCLGTFVQRNEKGRFALMAWSKKETKRFVSAVKQKWRWFFFFFPSCSKRDQGKTTGY